MRHITTACIQSLSCFTPTPYCHAHWHHERRPACSRKTLIYLILTLNHCYPDYDFSLLRAHHFRKEPGVAAVEEAVDSHLLEVSKVSLFPPSKGHRNMPALDLSLLQSAMGVKRADVDPTPEGKRGRVSKAHESWADNAMLTLPEK